MEVASTGLRLAVKSATDKPVDVISLAAGRCYGKCDVRPSRVAACHAAGHMGVFEHATATFDITGISRACSHQLVRHRMASYCQMSQRYVAVDTRRDDWYVTPPSILRSEEALEAFREAVRSQGEAYNRLLDEGIRSEDARFILPEAAKTELYMTCNLREIYHILDLRCSKRAQWEIRLLAFNMWRALRNIDDQWKFLMDLHVDEEDMMEVICGNGLEG